MSQRSGKAYYWQDAPLARDQLTLFPTSLEDRIPAEHPVRLIDEILDLVNWTPWEAVYHGSFGKPPIHPSVLAKVLLFAMTRRLRSSRQIEYNLGHSIDFIWLASGRTIDHTTLSEFRRKHKKELADVFRQVIKLAIDLKVANLGELCIDGTRVFAAANRRKTWTSERLAKAIKIFDEQIQVALAGLEATDALDEDLLGEDISAERLPAEVADLKDRRERLAKLHQQSQQMDAARKKNNLKGHAQLPKTDPDARILPNKEGGYAANYTPMATVETEGGLIVVCDVVIGNVEHEQLLSAVTDVTSQFDAEVARVMADTAFTTGENLSGCEANDVELLGPLAEVRCKDNPVERADPSEPVAQSEHDRLPINPKTKVLDKSAFVYDAESDCYYCPVGRTLPLYTTKMQRNEAGESSLQHHVYRCKDCSGCPLLSRCRKNVDSKQGREMIRDAHEPARERHRERMKTEEAQSRYKRRQHFGEVPFAAIKSGFEMRRFLLRGIEGVRQEWRWASLAYNVKKLASHWPTLRDRSAHRSSIPTT